MSDTREYRVRHHWTHLSGIAGIWHRRSPRGGPAVGAPHRRCNDWRRQVQRAPCAAASARRSASDDYSGFCQTEMWLRLELVKGSRFQSLHRSRTAIPARRAMRSNSDGHTLRNGAEKDVVSPFMNQ